MKGTFFHNQRFLSLSILFMWIKTYVIYKLGFDLQTDSLLQELILLINPLSFILPLFGIGLLLQGSKQRIFLLIANLVLTAILISNTIFYGFYIDFITIPVLFQASNMSDMGSSVKELFNPLFIALFADLTFLLLLSRKEKRPESKANPVRSNGTMPLPAGYLYVRWGLPKLNSRSSWPIPSTGKCSSKVLVCFSFTSTIPFLRLSI